VTFRYGPGADVVLRELDLAVPDGDHLAVVGPSGAGKSTLAALMCGVLRPTAGEVSLGGVPLHRFDPRTLASRRVVIPQEAYVFAGTVWENLTYYRPDAPAGAVCAAVEALGLAPVVARFGGLSARLDPDALSAGERQLVALVRAYLSPAPVAVLDEATCHLDPPAEARVEEAFARRPGTLVVVAHRISSAVRARRVVVLDRSGVQAGDHETLLATSSLYRELVGGWRVPV
jgi:ATP-binding cassette subfamily C protein